MTLKDLLQNYAGAIPEAGDTEAKPKKKKTAPIKKKSKGKKGKGKTS